MKKAIATILSVILSGALLVYAASRALDFISQTMPANQQAVGYFALFATEGGIIIWLLYHLYGAQGPAQRGISLLMVIVDTVGSFALYMMDSLMRAGQFGLIDSLSPAEVRTVIMGLNALILLNVAAGVACHLTDPDAQRKAAESEAQDIIQAEALAAITKDAGQLAAELAPTLSGQWVQEMRAKYKSLAGLGFEKDQPKKDDNLTELFGQPVAVSDPTGAQADKHYCFECRREFPKPAVGLQLYCSPTCEKAALIKRQEHDTARLAELGTVRKSAPSPLGLKIPPFTWGTPAPQDKDFDTTLVHLAEETTRPNSPAGAEDPQA